MYFTQILRTDMGCAAYLIGAASGDAAVVDPRLDMVDEILALTQREQLRLRYIIETHNHADHVSGHHALAARTGAAIAIHEVAGVAYPHLPLRDGDELELGEARLRVLHTPGHRPEHIAIAVSDTTRGNDPWLVLTGDSLFIGDVARPDLAIPGQEGAVALFHSLHEQLLTLPDGTLVFPAHVSGSLCGRVTSRMTATTVGYERAFNPALTIQDEGAFVRYTTESLPVRPPQMARIVDLNAAATPPPTDSAVVFSADEVNRLRAEGALMLDVRSPAEFAAGHVPGALSVQIEGAQFPTRAGLTLPHEADLVLVAARESQAREAITALSVIGRDRVLGFLEGSVDTWARAGLPLETLPSLSATELRDRVQPDGADSLLVLDVREPSEWEAGHIHGAMRIPFHQVTRQVQALERTRPIAVICATGHRSTIAASLLQAAGFEHVSNVVGGMVAWNHAEAARELAVGRRS